MSVVIEELIKFIYSSIDIQITNTLEENNKYLEDLILKCHNKEKVIECLRRIEEYLAQTNYTHLINKELDKLQYYKINTAFLSRTQHAILLDSYSVTPLIKLLHIRFALIEFLKNGCNDFSQDFKIHTGSWEELWLDNSVRSKLKDFFGSDSQAGIPNIATVEKQIEEELNHQLNLSKNSPLTHYFAFSISNGIYTEPYILKISNGLVSEVIFSRSRHSSSDLHSYLIALIESNNPLYKKHFTLPLIHNGDCTRYSDYALIQFDYLSETQSADEAFALLSQDNPYECTEETLRDFQMLSYFCSYDPLKKMMYPLPELVATELSSSALTKYEVVKSTQEELPKSEEKNEKLNIDLAQYQQKFQVLLKQLEVERDLLTYKASKNSSYCAIEECVSTLYQTLNNEMKKFFNKPSASRFLKCHNKCLLAIGNAEEESKKHRGWHAIDPIIRGIIGVFAAIAIIPALIVAVCSPYGYVQTFFSKPEQTTTSEKIDTLIKQFSCDKLEFEQENEESAEVRKTLPP